MEPISNIQPVKTPDLRGHVIKNQGGVSVILCSICAEPFTSFASLGAHMQMHAAEERSRHICDFKGCAKRFENNDQLVLHMKQAHSTPGKSKIWMCTVCDTAYTRLENLTNHFNHEHRVNLTKILAPAPDIKEDDDRSVIRCGICKDRFASYATFLAHLPMHKEIYRCDFESCEQKFRQRKPLVQHIKYDHHTVIWECTSCDFVSSQYPNLNKHVQESHANKPEEKAEVQSATDTQPNKPETKTEIPSLSGTQAKAPVAKKPPETKSVKLIFKCGICQNYMGGEEALAIHMDQHLKTKVYSCDSEGCRKKFASRETLIKHFENFHGVKNRDILCACSLCDSVFIQAVSLHKHQKLKHLAKLEKIEILCSTEGHLKCGICPEKFCTKEALEKHIIGHLRSIERSGSPFCCKRCFQTVPQYRRLTQHYSHLHRTPWPYFDFECEFCPRRFERESRFLEHLKFHRGNGPKCDLCDKQFSTKIALSIHTKNVHARREYVCEICGGRYGLLDNFKRHLLTHNVETVYECSHCEFSSLSKFILRNHIKHHLEKTPKCKICVVCNAKFTSKGQFDYHMGKHTGSDYFQCEVCKKVYTMIRHLREHKKFEHGLLSYKCDSCTKEYTNNKALKKHKLKEHPNNL